MLVECHIPSDEGRRYETIDKHINRVCVRVCVKVKGDIFLYEIGVLEIRPQQSLANWKQQMSPGNAEAR